MKDGLIKFDILKDIAVDALQTAQGNPNLTSKLFVKLSYYLVQPKSKEDEVQTIDDKL